MTSAAFSDAPMTSYHEVTFPPRAGLPPGVTIAKLPGLGTSWYERGILYWARRVGNVLMLCIAVAVYAAIITGVVLAAGRPGSPGFLAVLIAEIVFSLATGVFSFRHLWRIGIGRPARPANGGFTSAGLSAALGAFWLGGIGALILVVSVVLSSGFALAALAIWLVPVPPTERRARRQLADELKVNRLAADLQQHYHQARSHRKRGGRRR
jgi:hypothetical protein